MLSYQNQVQLFKVLIHPTRLAILDVLRDGEQCVCHLEAALGLRQAHISQHLMVLRDAGLVTDRRDGWNMFYRVCKPEIYAVIEAANAMSGAADPAKAEKRQAAANNTCPCPKCNSGTDNIKIVSPALAFDLDQAAI
jgi:DNA-binding transcriptional ArsR family regulator